MLMILIGAGLAVGGRVSSAQSPDDARAQRFFGPADVRNQRPYQLLFLTFSPETADVLSPRTDRLAVQLIVANDLLIPNARRGDGRAFVEEDAETQRLTLTARRGLGGGREGAVMLPVMARDGGLLDPVIEAYHRLAGFPNHTVDTPTGRGSLPMFRSVIRLDRADGTTEVNAGSVFGLGDVAGSLKQSIVSGRWTSVAVRAGMKVPTGSAGQLLGSGGMDVGLDADVKVALSGRVALFVNAGYIWMQKDERVAAAATHAWETMTAVEYRASPRDDWALQSDGSDVVVRTGNVHADGSARTLTLAYRHVSSPHQVLTFEFTENGDIVNYRAPWLVGIGPDVAFGAGVEWRR